MKIQHLALPKTFGADHALLNIHVKGIAPGIWDFCNHL